MTPKEILANTACSDNDIRRLKAWAAYQSWQKVLFLHWSIRPELLLPLIPQHKGLQIDTYADKAFLSLVGFNVCDAHMRFLPPVPGTASFVELNLRTYVLYNNIPGIVFFHIDANKPIATAVYRMTGLPYHNAKIARNIENTFNHMGDEPAKNLMEISWSSSPVHGKSELDSWLTERYYTFQQRGNDLYCYPICHVPWKIGTANVFGTVFYQWKNILLTEQNMQLAHYSEGVDALFYLRKKI